LSPSGKLGLSLSLALSLSLLSLEAPPKINGSRISPVAS
jgi:hypothetical protein